MAHFQQQKFVQIISQYYPDFFRNKKILEVGSWNANETVRKFFINCDYIGADIAPGPGVDLVCPGQDLSFSNNEFDLVISGECFEHNPEWVSTFKNMHRMLKPGGLCLITCASIGRGEHGTQRKSPTASLTVQAGHVDYYKNLSKNDFISQLKLNDSFDAYKMFYNIYFCDLYFIGIKKQNNINIKIEIPQKLCTEVENINEFLAPSIKRKIAKYINFWTTFAWASLLGEARYHDWKYKLSSSLKR